MMGTGGSLDTSTDEQQHFEIIGLGLEEPLPPQEAISDL